MGGGPHARFWVLTAMAIIWVVTPCSLVEFTGASEERKSSKYSIFCLIGLLFGPEQGGACSLKASVNFYQTTGRHIPEDITLHLKNAVREISVVHKTDIPDLHVTVTDLTTTCKRLLSNFTESSIRTESSRRWLMTATKYSYYARMQMHKPVEFRSVSDDTRI